MEQKKSLVLLNFSGVYEKQDFYKKCMERGARCVDLRGIPGTNCYCDQESEEKIKEQLMVSGVKGIHYLDSGNYHYVTKLWMDLIREPFDLLVFDHHTDLQPPFFGDILSCGGWIQGSPQEEWIPFHRLSGWPSLYRGRTVGGGNKRVSWQDPGDPGGGTEIPEPDPGAFGIFRPPSLHFTG